MNWRTDKPTAEIIVALISDGGGYDVLYRRDDGRYVDRYDEPPYSIIEKWADLEEDETVTDCHELEKEIRTYCNSSFKFNYDELNDSFYSNTLKFDDIVELACHFYKLGLNTRKEE